jgi:uncharacterized damage-inducible protein DinB
MTGSRYPVITCLTALCCADVSVQLPTSSPRSHAASVAARPAEAPEADFKSMFAKHWRVAQEFTLAVADAMPADGYDFKPNPEELSFGRLMTHIGAQNSDSCASATGTDALPEPAVTDKATAIRYLTETFDKCALALGKMPPERLGAEVYKFSGQPVLAREALWYAFTHMAHHRGQAEVYLRVKNIKPPAWRF